MPVVTGVGTCSPEKPGAISIEEMVFAAASAALADGGISRNQLGGVCLASSDQLDGRAISSMHMAGPAGAVLRDETKVADDGALAFAVAVMRVEAGLDDNVLAVSWSRNDSSDSIAAIGVNAEPIYSRPSGLHPLAVEAMVIREYMTRTGLSIKEVDQLAERWGSSDAGGWLSYPVRSGHVPPETSAAIAILVSRGRPGVAVSGLAWGIDPAAPGQRARGGSLAEIGARAIAEAGLDESLPGVETTDRSVVRRLIAASALGLTSPADAFDFFMSEDSRLVNSSGGLWSSNPIFAAGLEVVARCVQRVREGEPAVMAHSSYGQGGQGNFVAVIGEGNR